MKQSVITKSADAASEEAHKTRIERIATHLLANRWDPTMQGEQLTWVIEAAVKSAALLTMSVDEIEDGWRPCP